jgi:hypothetical protein
MPIAFAALLLLLAVNAHHEQERWALAAVMVIDVPARKTIM